MNKRRITNNNCKLL